MGLGVLGRGAGDAEFLAQCGADVLVTDLKSEEQLQSSLVRLHMYENITYRLGAHTEEDFVQCDMVIKAAGVPLDSPFIEAARKAGVAVYMSTALFAKFAQEEGAMIIGITGTRGKSTISHLINHTLAHAHRRTLFGGNVRGVSTLALVPQVRAGDYAVLELDSWQLQGFGDLEISPQISIFSNLMPDHLNYYRDMDRYFRDKANIFFNQKPGEHLIVGASLVERVQALQPINAPVVPGPIPDDWKLNIPGDHNRHNAALARAALQAAGLSDEEIRRGFETFFAIEGRLQFVREVKGVKIYNDNNATTPHATIAALDSFPRKTVVLIAGGADKEIPLDELALKMLAWCKHVFLLDGTGTKRLKQLVDAPVYASLEAAFKDAYAVAQPGDVLLFSPAFASFGMFTNEYDRNDQFRALVKQL